MFDIISFIFLWQLPLLVLSSFEILFDTVLAQKFFPLPLVAVEGIDVHLRCDARHPAIVTHLPESQVDIRFVFAIACNPEQVVAFQVRGQVEPGVDKALVDIEYGACPCASLNYVEPCANVAEHHLLSTHQPDLCIAWLDVEHRWQVATLESGITEEVGGLLLGRLLG